MLDRKYASCKTKSEISKKILSNMRIDKVLFERFKAKNENCLFLEQMKEITRKIKNVEPNSFSSSRAFENLIAYREKAIMEDKSRLNREIEKEEQENENLRETFVEFQSDLEIKERELQSMKNELQELQQNVKLAKFKNQNLELQLFNKEKEKNEASVKLKGQLTSLQRKQRALVQQKLYLEQTISLMHDNESQEEIETDNKHNKRKKASANQKQSSSYPKKIRNMRVQNKIKETSKNNTEFDGSIGFEDDEIAEIFDIDLDAGIVNSKKHDSRKNFESNSKKGKKSGNAKNSKNAIHDLIPDFEDVEITRYERDANYSSSHDDLDPICYW
jgi:chromosome segregation ATPase